MNREEWTTSGTDRWVMTAPAMRHVDRGENDSTLREGSSRIDGDGALGGGEGTRHNESRVTSGLEQYADRKYERS